MHGPDGLPSLSKGQGLGAPGQRREDPYLSVPNRWVESSHRVQCGGILVM